MSDQISEALLAPHLNETFKIKSAVGEELELTLIESKDESKEKIELFWFIFEGPADQPISQETYTLIHPELGELLMFLVPVASSKKDTCHYQALFNRIQQGE